MSAGAEDLAGADLTGADLTGADLAGADLTGTGVDMVGNQMGDLGVVGSMCTSACDCRPGLACFAGECRMGISPVYCCTASNCPANEVCQNPGGNYGRCASAGTDGGIDICPFINCTGGGVQMCMNQGCTMCVATGVGPMMRCSK